MRASRGFTLLELMTSMVITVIILLSVAAAFTATQTIYQREAQLKSSVESGRVATGYIERLTRFIGYGIDPRFAIDLSTANLPSTTKTNFPGFANTSTATMTGFITDDFAFRYRDPAYLRRGRYDGTNVVIDNAGGGPANFNIDLQAGRLIQIVCTGGQQWAVVKTSAAIVPASTSVAAGSANIVTNPTSFPPPPTSAAAPCLIATGINAPYIMLVREVRLRIIPLGTAPNIRPYLVAYNGLDQTNIGTGATDFDPIAADVESFQVSYMMNKGAVAPLDDPAGGDFVLGNATTDTVKLPIVAGTRPDYAMSYSDPARFNADVANVRAVVFDLSIRSLRAEKRSSFPQPRLADDPAAPLPPDGYFHVAVSTTVRTPNLTSRSTFTPPLKVAGDPTQLNEWGG